MMGFILGLVAGAFLGYGGAWAQYNPVKRAELVANIKALFKRKP